MHTSHISFKPNRISITPRRKASTMSMVLDKQVKKALKKEREMLWRSNFTKPNNAFKISNSSKRKILDSVNYLYALSDARNIIMKNGKTLFNFRASFITLTLPSEQIHDDVTIKKECINQLLVELRKYYNVENWVWKAELQKNQNIHFHLITDMYVDFQALRRRWNRIINKLGYVDAYANKFSKMSLHQYNMATNGQGKTPFNIIKKRFTAGKKSKWKNPNSVDVRSVRSAKDLASYLAKYIAKSFDTSNFSDDEQERGLAFGRVWSRSYSLTKFDQSPSIDPDEWKDVLYYFNNTKDKVKKYVGDWFEVFYYNLDDLQSSIKVELRNFFKNWARFLGYNLPMALNST